MIDSNMPLGAVTDVDEPLDDIDYSETTTDRGLQHSGQDKPLTTEHLDECNGCPLCEL